MTITRVLWVGDRLHHEFREAASWLAEYTALSWAADGEGAVRQLAQTTAPPDVVVLAQPRPNPWHPAQLESLRQSAPQARFIALLGGWCEGSLRHPLPGAGVEAVYWHQFLPRCASALGRRERAQGEPSAERDAAPLVVAIWAESLEAYQSLAESCCEWGYATAWLHPLRQPSVPRAAAGLFDCRSGIEASRGDLAAFVARLAPAPVIALVGFPRGDDVRIAQAAGAASVLSKPFSHQDLAAKLLLSGVDNAGATCPP